MRHALGVPAILLLLVAHVSDAQMGDSSELGSNVEQFGGSGLAYYPPSVHHRFSCADDGIWKNSCDVNQSAPNTDVMTAPAIYSPADWSERCDPWKGVTEINTLTYDSTNGVWVNATGHTITDWTNPVTGWTCPEHMRSMSGCGDFRTDTRNETCDKKTSLFNCGRPLNADRRIFSVGNFMPPQRHVCIQHPIFYDNLNSDDPVVPPARGRHRERWAKYGEYDYLPPQRWMHNLEHGSIVFLYDPCLDEASLCALRRYIQKWQKKVGKIMWGGSNGDNDDEFRFILTPFKDLWTPISILAWGYIYSSKCFNEQDMDYFVEKHYRNGFEDWPPDGAYNYLWKDIETAAASCDPLPEPGPDEASYMLAVQKAAMDASGSTMNGSSSVDTTQMMAMMADMQYTNRAQDSKLAMAHTEIDDLKALVQTLQTQVSGLMSAMSSIRDVCKTNETDSGRLLSESGNSDPCDDSAPGDDSNTESVFADSALTLAPGLFALHWLGVLMFF